MPHYSFLLLDEPTNHLDLEATFWLERFLQHYPGTLILISHDRLFLDNICSHIVFLDNQKLTLYAGNYSDFEKLRSEQLALQQAQYARQQKHIEHLMKFVNRFRAKATKAKQAQSRLKTIEKMEKIAQAHIDSPFSFEFKTAETVHTTLVKLEKVDLGYDQATILKQVNFYIEPEERIALLGPNGAGKSTFIKALARELSSLNLQPIEYAKKLKIGYFAQHQIEQLDIEKSALDNLLSLDKNLSTQEARNYLGGFNFHGEKALEPIVPFSGGEKARLALALLIYQRPNLLLLDEPTNHFDMDMRHAIEMALQGYEGALVLISHDRHFLSSTVDKFYLVANNKVELFKGDLDDYRQWVSNTNKTTSAVTEKKKPDFKVNKQVKNQLKKIELQLEKLEQKKNDNEQALHQDDIYDDKEKLNHLISQQQKIENEIETLENEWMKLQDD